MEAINATTGHTSWTSAAEATPPDNGAAGDFELSSSRGVAVNNGKLFVIGFDDELRALRQSNGKELWSSTVASPGEGSFEAICAERL